MAKAEQVGEVAWHSSGPDEGPDVGLSLHLGPKEGLWVGEVSRSLFDECNGAENFPDDGGWFLVHHKPTGPVLLAKFSDQYVAQEFIEQIGALVRAANTPSN